ncbi:DUF4231 domain-containing protein [Streptomyces sp. NPDC005732]|uniref:DUF4231 domain-containing protein n=1 Tax=Streptomyces sp. NPDC005732 TaxID=3157057 RepID=UPI0033E2EBE5
MTQTSEDTVLRRVWDKQSVWSQAANRSKTSVDRARTAALAVGVLTAVLATAAAQTMPDHRTMGQLLACAAALAAGCTPLIMRSAGPETVNAWIRTRAVSEALKAEVYLYMTRTGVYGTAAPAITLMERLDQYQTDAADLIPGTTSLTAADRPLPNITGLDSYVEHRLRRQLHTYYRPKAELMQSRVRTVKRIELLLGLLSAVLAAVSAGYALQSVASWISVVASINATVIAHATAQRYAYQHLEFTRTAHELERLLGRWEQQQGEPSAHLAEEFVSDCEAVISIQNEAWMIRWTRD